ncbi:MAG: hypothetical protein C0173_06695 [Desulfurella sp.]|uniref:hypothetical protein n=1 Tax=Desulfurella sp. TaxID=1962857 RepID=UPI000CC686D5|nr:hypothetical protein [Desulfurella sp.]PMP88726.1 MAG: hypothetical protein C0173_06695 [Desulfurella sp.]HEX14247.1 hypothetical protein [Desulfurella acetivorans]
MKKKEENNQDIVAKTEKLLTSLLDAQGLSDLEKIQVIETATKFLAVKNRLSMDSEWAKALSDD